MSNDVNSIVAANMPAGSGHPLFRQLQSQDRMALGDFFERNNCPEITGNFSPFPLTHGSAQTLLAPDSRDLFFAFEIDETIIGFSMLRGWDEGHAIPSFGVFVAVAMRGKGFGHRLTEWTLRWADQAGIRCVRLSVYADNLRAFEMYKKFGFSESDRNVLANGRSKVVMHRKSSPFGIPVYVSTSALAPNETFRSRLASWVRAGLCMIECTTYPHVTCVEAIESMRSIPAHYLLHNYFPPPQVPLVLNLASPSPAILERSRQFYRCAIKHSAEFGAKWFSLHAGFICDPCGRDEFGFLFPAPTEIERSAAEDRFVREITSLATFAEAHGVSLLVENNVCSKSNKGKLLLCTPEDFRGFLERVRSIGNLGVLLDTGHLFVSGQSLGFDPLDFVALSGSVVGIHLHGNDGHADQHLPTRIGGSCLEFAARFKPQYVTLEGRYNDLGDLQRSLLEIEHLYYARINSH